MTIAERVLALRGTEHARSTFKPSDRLIDCAMQFAARLDPDTQWTIDVRGESICISEVRTHPEQTMLCVSFFEV